MKLYATVTSERESRPVKKGGDEYIHVHLTRKGLPEMSITFYPEAIQILRLSPLRKDEKGQPIVVNSEQIRL